MLQKKRFEKLLSSDNPVKKALTELPSFKSTLRKVNLPCRIGKETVCSTEQVKLEWAKQLRSSADGRENVTHDVDEASFYWLEKPNRVFPRLHLRGIQLRGRVLHTKARAARGRERLPKELQCRGACKEKETLNNILQKCEVTHNARCARHSWKNVKERVNKNMDRANYTDGQQFHKTGSNNQQQ